MALPLKKQSASSNARPGQRAGAPGKDFRQMQPRGEADSGSGQSPLMAAINRKLGKK